MANYTIRTTVVRNVDDQLTGMPTDPRKIEMYRPNAITRE